VLGVAFAALSLAVGLGMWLAAGAPGRADLPRWKIGLAHGIAGAGGVLALLVAWGGSVPGTFAKDALALLVVGLIVGAGMALFAARSGRLPMAAVAIHAALAGIGYLILAGFVLG
jgi:hypothetical protein